MTHSRWGRWWVACTFVLLLTACDHANDARPRPGAATTSTSTRLSPTTASTVPGDLLPDPRVTTCDGTQLAMNGCSYQRLQEAEAELRVAVGVMGKWTGLGSELDQLQIGWQAGRDRLCDQIPSGGSGYSMFVRGCRERSTRHRIDELYAVDIATDAPRPSNLWGRSFDPPGTCVQRMNGSITGTQPLFGEVSLVDSSSSLVLELDDDFVGLARGSLQQRAVLANVDGSTFVAAGQSTLWGERVVDTIAGVYESKDVIDGEPKTSYGYWYLVIDGATARGEIINLADADARSELTATITSC